MTLGYAFVGYSHRFRRRTCHTIRKFVHYEMAMHRQASAVLVVCQIKKLLKELGIKDTDKEVKARVVIWYEGDEEEKNLNTLLDLLNESETREEDETYQNPVDMMFQELEERDPQHFAVRQYKKYKMAAGKTAKSILISCGARLAPFDIAELREIMSYDEMELDKIGDRKTALFLIMSDTDTTFNFVIAMLQSQLFNLLCDKADDEYGGRLPVHVRVIADEFANSVTRSTPKMVGITDKSVA